MATVTPGTLELSDQRQDLASLNRDAGAAHVSVEAYDIARLKARQEGAAALSELLNGLTGDLSVKIGLKDGGPAKAALHAAVGAAVAAVAGTDIGTGAAAGLVSELANGVVSQMLKDHPELTKAQQDAIRQWTATALGAAIGGQAGAAAALDNIKHNYLSHVQLEEFKEKLLACGGDPVCEQEVGAEYRDLSRSQNEELLDAISASDLDVLWNAYKSGNSADLYESILKSLGPDSEAAAIFYDVFWKGAVVQTGSGTQGYFTEIAFFTIRDILAERLLAGNPDASLSDLARLAQLELGEDVLSPQLGQIIGAVASVRYSKAKQSNAGQNSNDTEPSNGSAFPDSKQNAGQGQGDKAGGGATGSNSRQWDNWQPPAGYTRNADGTVTHNGSGQLYTPVRDASGNVRFDSRGNPVFNTQSAGSTAQTTLTQPSTSGPVINAPAPNTAGRTALIDDLIAGGAKITPENVVDIRKLPDGRTVWLETGSDTAGLQHIYRRHEVDFSNKGISREQIPAVVMDALQQGHVVGTNGSADVYRIVYNGAEQHIAIGVGSNGFVVRANPVSQWKPLP